MDNMTIEQRRSWLRNLKPGDKVASKNCVCNEYVIHTVTKNVGKVLATTGFYTGQEIHFDNETGDGRVSRVGIGRVILLPISDKIIAKTIASKVVDLIEDNRRNIGNLPLNVLVELLASVQNAVNYIPEE